VYFDCPKNASSRDGPHATPTSGSAVRAGDQSDIMISMTKMLEEAIKKVRDLPDADQDEAAAILLSVASKRGDLIELDDETRAAIKEGRQQARRGEFANDKDMAAFFRRQGVKRYGA
jgi:hypothetical protein